MIDHSTHSIFLLRCDEEQLGEKFTDEELDEMCEGIDDGTGMVDCKCYDRRLRAVAADDFLTYITLTLFRYNYDRREFCQDDVDSVAQVSDTFA